MAPLIAVPNFSEGRDPGTLRALTAALERASTVHDRHADADHNRAVLTVSGEPTALLDALLAAAAVAVERIDLRAQTGAHPRVGVLDVAPIVHRSEPERGPATATALVLGDRLAEELALPVFLYGALSPAGHSRAALRRGGPAELARRIAVGELRPDFGPARLHPTGGAVLVTARPPLVAFNLELAAPATLADARRIAALIREGGPEGLPGVRAIGVQLHHPDRAQISTNVEDHHTTALAEVLAAVAAHARVARAELVGVAPRAAFRGFPDDLPLSGRRYLEDLDMP